MKQTNPILLSIKTSRIFFLICIFIVLSNLPLSAQDIWEPANGPYGGSIYAITSTPNGTVYAGTQYGGLFKSTNNGMSWQPGGYSGYVYSLLAISDSMIFLGSTSSNMYRTTDFGGTWEKKNDGLPSSSVKSMVYSSDGFIFAATGEGIYRTGNYGDKWIAVNIDSSSLNVNILLITNENIIYAGTQSGRVFRSSSSGESWDLMSSGLPSSSVIALTMNSDGHLFAGFGTTVGVYKSEDSGSSWSYKALSGRSITYLAVNSNDDLFAGTWQAGIYRSKDDGGSWTSMAMGPSPLIIETIHVDPSNEDVYVGCIWYNGGGIYYSRNDGDSWEPRNEGLKGIRVWKVAASQASGTVFAGTYYNGIFRSRDMGISWEPLGNGMPELQSTFIRGLAVHPSGTIFSGSGGGGVHRSINEGDEWMRIDGGTGYRFVGAVAVREDGVVFFGESDSDGGIFMSTDEGATWDEITNGLNDKAIKCIAFNQAAHIYVGTARNGVYRSTNNGASWSPVGMDLSTYEIFDIAVNSKGHVFATVTGQGVFYTIDNSNWTIVGEGVLGTTNYPIEINSKDHIFTGLSNLWVSKDDGITWLNYDTGLDSYQINDLALDMEERLFAATQHGVFKTFESTTATRIHFSVKMKHHDGFDPANDQVVARGFFNNWGEFDLPLYAQEDSDWTYEGTAMIINSDDAIRDGRFEFKYAIPRGEATTEDDEWENFPYNRSVEWNGESDLQLEDVWFSNERDFTRMQTNTVMADTTRSFGVAWADFNGDGVEDIVVTQGGSGETPYYNELFEGKVDGNFVKINAGPVVTEDSESRAACWGDYDNDGHLDLLVTNPPVESIKLYRNKGDGTFDRMDIGISENTLSIGAVWVDINNDSYLDIFVSNASGQNNFLYMNNEGSSFTKVTDGVVVNDGGDSRGCAAVDFNHDGYMDLYVANSGQEPGEFDFLYMNNGDSSFTKITSDPIVTEKGMSMGGSWGDYDNDGWLDLYVTYQGGKPNKLFKNLHGTGFATVTESELPADSSYSEGSAWVDYDNDGWLDLLVTNFGSDERTNFLYRNSGGFSRVETGPMIEGWERNSHGAAWGDYNNDGAPDLCIATHGGLNGLYRNNLSGNNWLKVRLTGTISNTAAIGATVVLKTSMQNNEGNEVVLRRTIEGQSGFLSQNSPTLMFGLGDVTTIDSVIIYWPSGIVNKYDTKPVNQTMDFVEYEPSIAPPKVILNSPLDSATDVPVPVMVAWNATTGASFYQLQVANDAAFTDMIFDQNTLTGTTQAVTEAASGNTYYWRVRAGAGVWGEWSDPWKFTTGGPSIQEPPPAPGLTNPSNGQTNVKIPPTLSWNAVGGAQKYWFQVAESNDFSTGMMAQDSNTSFTSYTTGGGNYSTIYYWHVKAKNEFGWGDWSNVWSFTTEALTGLPDAPTLVGPVDNQTGVPIPAPLVWSSVDGNYEVQIATDASFSNIVFTRGDNPERYLFANEGLNHNQQYYWHVRVQVQGINSDWSQSWKFTTYDNKVVLNNQTVNFPFHERKDEFSPSDYRMLGLPGNADVAFTDVLGDGANENWMAYWDNGKTGNPSEYLVAYDGSGIFRFVTGKGFWVIHNGSINITQSIPNAPLNELAQAEINVHQGWNIITCPFLHSIKWSAIKFVNDITIVNPIFRYNYASRNFESYDNLEPVEGFYFYNGDPARTKLLIPYVDGSGKVSAQSELSWEVSLELSSGESIDASAKVGVAADAEMGFDRYEYRKPRGIADLANIYFDRPEWDDNYSVFANDIRPEIDEMETWDFKVYAPENEKSKFSLIGLESIPEEYEVYLIDKTHQRYQNLRENDVYDFNSTPQISDFELVVGLSDAVEEKIESILPAEFALGQNYPNPFNPTTTIPLTLPEQSDITLKVYNLLGQEVATIFKGNLEAGKHYLLWNGTNQANHKMPSGVYMYQMLTTKGLRLTGKMVLIK